MAELADVMNEAEELECCQHCQDNILKWFTLRGYHVVQEGQAVVNGQVWGLASSGDAIDRFYRLRPLTDEPPP